jgi:hypothetical protein
MTTAPVAEQRSWELSEVPGRATDIVAATAHDPNLKWLSGS